MKIGNIDLGERPVILAPMEDVTDASFRFICKEYGADMVYTEFISSDGLIRDAVKTIAKMQVCDAERPVGIQIYGHIPDAMVEAAVVAAVGKHTAGTEALMPRLSVPSGCFLSPWGPSHIIAEGMPLSLNARVRQ